MQELRPRAGYGEGVREQVLEVIIRQALAGAPWREICAGPMQVNDIPEEEVEGYVQYRQKRLSGKKTDVAPEHAKKLEEFSAFWAQSYFDTQLDRQKATAAVNQTYAVLGFKPPIIVFCESSLQMLGFLSLVDQQWVSTKYSKQNLDLDAETSERFWNNFAAQADSIESAITPEDRLEGKPFAKAIFAAGQGRTLYDATSLRNCFNRIPIDTRAEIRGYTMQLTGQRGQVLASRVALRMVAEAFKSYERNMYVITQGMPSPAEAPPPLRHFVARNILGFENEYSDIDFRGVEAIYELTRRAWQYAMFERICFVCAPPSVAHFDTQQRPHRTDGPALAWSDGFKIFAVNGIEVESRIVEHPDTITVAEIELTGNAEFRRVLVELYGTEKFLRDSNAVLIDEDAFGKLYRKDMQGDEPIVMVAVQNSTPEPDGSFKTYFLRVPPDMSTARQAVAWTFAMSAHEYRPEFQS